ncbi:hypothetical protein [Paenibacillus humicola]|uniref:hypothetical protein n=1 Tax=Paenibacillus humicola TaxID=3110540 RepID=UPI00237B1628|nr:hypothetical protein [Paenibacillus humicola]
MLLEPGIVVGTVYADEQADFAWVRSAPGVTLFTLTEENRDRVPGIIAGNVQALLLAQGQQEKG